MKRFFYSIATLFLVFATTNLYLGNNLFSPDALQEAAESPVKAAMAEQMELGIWTLPDINSLKDKALNRLIEKKSLEFVITAFLRDNEKMERLLAKGTSYVLLADGDSYIRFDDKQQYVEGYMATDKALVRARHKWYVIGDDGTITSGIELSIQGEKTSQTWFLHFKKIFGQWKIFMLENGI